MKYNIIKTLSSFLLLSASFASFAGPFDITVASGTSLPTTVIEDGYSFAYYKVTNITSKNLSENFVKHLPDNVTQVTDNPAYCAQTFALDSGDSCVLQLVATGAVALSNDSAKNIFVCADPYDCSGVVDNHKLNIQVVSALTSGQYCNGNCDPFGEAAKSNPGFKPLLMQRSNDNWAALSLNSNHLPENYFDYGQLSGIACSDNFCMAGGSYNVYYNYYDYLPLLAMSPNGASNWNYQQNFADDLVVGQLFATSCTDESCTSVGSACSTQSCPDYIPSENYEFFDPLYVYSLDGYSWTTVDVIDQINNDDYYGGNGFLVSAGCSSDTCVAGGSYRSSNFSTNVPLLLENGVFVTELYSQANTDICSFNQCGTFYATSCSSDWCIAAGGTDYGGDIPFALDYILLAVKDLSSGSWAYAKNFMKDVNDSSQRGGLITSANCSGDFCLVGGEYCSSNSPLLAQSSDGFDNWTYIDLGAIPSGTPIEPSNVPEDYNEIGEILSVTCYEETCLAVGYYYTEDDSQIPLLLQTTNAGSAWSFITTLPSDLGNGEFFATNCSADICVAAGTYETKDNLIKPLLAQSVNGGSWTFVNSLPNDFKDFGQLTGVNAPGGANASGTDAQDLSVPVINITKKQSLI